MQTDEGARNPRILHLVGNLAQGGSERQAIQLAGLMKKSGGYEVQLATLVPNGALKEEAERLGFVNIPAYPLTSFYDWNMAKQLQRCATQLRSYKVSLIHTHDFYSNVFGMLAAVLAGVPVRIASRRELGAMRTPVQQWVERRAYNLAHAVVANSEAVMQQLLREGVAKRKPKVIYNGLDLQRVNPPSEKTRQQMLSALGLPLANSCRFVTMVANLRHAVKDHSTFLRAAEQVSREVPEAYFVIAGEGELLEPTRQLAYQLNLHDQTIFLGRCGEIAELLALSEVCVLSSKSEGFSNSILEYMAAAKPVVATDVGGADEAIIEGETGYLVPVSEHRVMARRIVHLLQNPQEARSLGKRGQEVVKEKFSCRVQLRNTEELYSQLLETHWKKARNVTPDQP